MREHEWRILQMNILAAIAGVERTGRALPPDADLERLCLHLHDAADLLDTVRTRVSAGATPDAHHAAGIGHAAR